jgi:acyl-CoA thioester hydrolase
MPTFSTLVTHPVMWGDMDAFGHINNVIYMRYFETARIQYFDRMAGMQGFPGDIKPILASISGNYKRPIVYPDVLQIRVGVTKLGNASMTMACEMYSDKGFLAFTGECVLVMYDTVRQRPVAVPQEIRDFVYTIDGEVSDK